MKKGVKIVSYINPALIHLPEGADLYSASDYSLEPLESNISKNGMISPVIIRTDENGKRELVCGKRRLICARLLRMKRIPCIKIKCTRAEAALFRLSERLSTAPPDCFEIADGISDLITNHGLSLSQAADCLGMTLSAAKDKLKLLDFPFELRQTAAEHLTQTQVITLLILPARELKSAIQYIIENNLSESQTRDYVNGYFSPVKAEPVRKAAIGDIRFFSNSIEKNLCTLSNAGYETDFSITDEERYVCYTVRIKKKADAIGVSAAKIC